MTQEELQQAAEKEFPHEKIDTIFNDVANNLRSVWIKAITSETAKRYWEENGWISVEDRLPNDREVVIICWVYQGVIKITSGIYSYSGYWQHGNATQLEVTHWRPLPSLPPNLTK